MAKCEFRRKNGQRCRADAQSGKGVCVFHDEARTADGHRARRAGGINRSRVVTALPPDTADVALRNAQDVCSLIAGMINQVRRGELDPGVAKTLGYLANTLLSAMQQGPLEERLAKLEATFGLETTEQKREVKPDEKSKPNGSN